MAEARLCVQRGDPRRWAEHSATVRKLNGATVTRYSKRIWNGWIRACGCDVLAVDELYKATRRQPNMQNVTRS